MFEKYFFRKMFQKTKFIKIIIVVNELTINKVEKYIGTITCREFYWEFVHQQRDRPTAIEKWEEIYYYVNFEWEYIFSLPYKVARATYLQSLQYQIINRYFPCASNVHKWYPDERSTCKYCDT